MREWHEQARALKAANPDRTYQGIADELGIGSAATVWKVLNSERYRESDRRTRDKRRERRREIDREYGRRNRALCEECGRPCGIGSGNSSRPSRRCAGCIEREVRERAERIAEWWAAGESLRMIAARLGWTHNHLAVEFDRIRRKWPGLLPYRYNVKPTVPA